MNLDSVLLTFCSTCVSTNWSIFYVYSFVNRLSWWHCMSFHRFFFLLIKYSNEMLLCSWILIFWISIEFFQFIFNISDLLVNHLDFLRFVKVRYFLHCFIFIIKLIFYTNTLLQKLIFNLTCSLQVKFWYFLKIARFLIHEIWFGIGIPLFFSYCPNQYLLNCILRSSWWSYILSLFQFCIKISVTVHKCIYLLLCNLGLLALKNAIIMFLHTLLPLLEIKRGLFGHWSTFLWLNP